METGEERFPDILGEKAEIFLDGEWIQGEIVAGYRFKDGIVTIKTDDGRKIWCPEAREDLYRQIPKKGETPDEKAISHFLKQGGEILTYYEPIMSALMIEMRKGNYRIRKAVTREEMPVRGFEIELKFIVEHMAKEIEEETGE